MRMPTASILYRVVPGGGAATTADPDHVGEAGTTVVRLCPPLRCSRNGAPAPVTPHTWSRSGPPPRRVVPLAGRL